MILLLTIRSGHSDKSVVWLDRILDRFFYKRPSGFSDQPFLFGTHPLVHTVTGDGVCRVLSVLCKYRPPTVCFILHAAKQGTVARLDSSPINRKSSLMNSNLHGKWCQPFYMCLFVFPGMVLVRSDSGQLLMIPQQMLAQMQAQSQAARPAAPTSTTPGQITSAQVMPSDHPQLI